MWLFDSRPLPVPEAREGGRVTEAEATRINVQRWQRAFAPAPGRTLSQWAFDRAGQGHKSDCPNRSKLNVYPCDCGYEMAWEQCLSMLSAPVEIRIVDKSQL